MSKTRQVWMQPSTTTQVLTTTSSHGYRHQQHGNNGYHAIGRPTPPMSLWRRGYRLLDLELEDGCACAGGGPAAIPLYTQHEVPAWLRGNPYVIKGYRSLLPFSVCVKSLFVWSNETLNIWSHLLGFLVFFVLMLYDNIILFPEAAVDWTDHVVVTLGLLCYQFCMLCSAGYHLFHCHSERASHRWLALDLSGICVGLLGCYLPGVHYAFYCLSVWRDVYLLIISCLFASVLFFQSKPRYMSQEWFARRLALYVGLTAYGVLPTAHWIYLNGGVSSEIVRLFAPRVTVMYLLGAAAFFFYISKFPERCFPGRFDFVGCSHQVWHVIVVVAFVWWHEAGKDLLQYRKNNPCVP